MLPLAPGLVLLLSGASAPFTPEALWEACPARRFLYVMFGALAIITLVPDTVLFLPRLLGYKG